MAVLRLALAQINTTVGDLDANLRRIAEAASGARLLGADVAAFPEMAVTGYPPEDLLLRPKFVADSKAALKRLAAETEGIALVVGFVDGAEVPGGPIYNAAAVLADGGIVDVYYKIRLPNHGVFDERRYFTRGRRCPVLDVNGVRLGLTICEDIWDVTGPGEVECASGAKVILNISASPFEMTKHHARLALVQDVARRNGAYTAYVNQVGGQDELVFDGSSIVCAPDGSTIAQAARFREELLVVDLDTRSVDKVRAAAPPSFPSEWELSSIGNAVHVPVSAGTGGGKRPLPPLQEPDRPDGAGEAYEALVLGTGDYVRKTGFQRALIALSGGIDSALTAAIAVDALGAENVTGITMPSRYSSEGSVADSADLAGRLGIDLWTLPIREPHRIFEETLAERFAGTEPGTAEENLQARIRGNMMMTVSNKFGWMVLTTGNKSEAATGYATLYGDMAGGFAVIKDVPKTLVYALAEYRNRRGPGSPIPQAVIDKPPSAELRPGQLDRDTLPPYEVLDRILERYVELSQSLEEITAAEQAMSEPRADEVTVRRVLHMVDRNEYKRRQGPPGVKITGLAFGRDRRLPIASRYRV